MNVKNKLRNRLVKQIQQLSTDKLTEVDRLLNKIETRLKSKEKTLSMAGHWKDIDISDLTLKLHDNRAGDRQIN